VPLPEMITPSLELPEMVFSGSRRCAANSIIAGATIDDTHRCVRQSGVPAAFVPMEFPSTNVSHRAVVGEMNPNPWFPEIRLPLPATVPPMVLLLAPKTISTPSERGEGREAVRGHTDAVALDDIARSPLP